MSADSVSAFTLFIETGIHAGTVQRLAPGVYTLGSELEADIILSDSQIEPIHLIVELDRQGMRLEPLQGAIAIEGESARLEPGGERHLPYPASFAIGDTSININAPKDAIRSKRRTHALVIAAAFVCLAMLGLQLVNPFAGGAADGPAFASMQPTSSTAMKSTGVTSTPDKPDVPMPEIVRVDDVAMTVPDVSIDEAAAALRARLADGDFADIEVKTAVDRIIVRGEADPERMSAWRDVRIWFDGDYGQDFLLVAHVEPALEETPPKLAIEAVWSGEDPYLIAGGRRFFVGASVGDGWTIHHIGLEEITFKRGDKSFSLTL